MIIILSVVVVTSCASVGEASVLRGRYYWGAEVESLQLCGSNKEYWVIGEEAVLQQLRDAAGKLQEERSQPYQPVYVEVDAVAEAKADDGFAADYDGVYRLMSVKGISVSVPLDCQDSTSSAHAK
jgi:hypothetical protein